MSARDEATERQVQAARPDSSTWLAANAGSGKTRVLTDRVARLLLDGVDPQRILCLTYTKAAASEMQNRLFRRLGEWAMLGDAPLSAALDLLGVDGALGEERLRQARTLFARAIETPGGLKIQTIHSFCASILRRFPLEAGVSPQFSEMEERAAELLCAEILDDFAEGAQVALIDAIARHVTDEGLDDLIKEVVGQRTLFHTTPGRAELMRAYGLPDGFCESDVLASVFVGGETALIASLLPALQGSGPADRRAAERLAGITGANMESLCSLESVLISGTRTKSPNTAKIGSFPTKALRQGPLAGAMPALEALMRRVEAARESRLALAAVEKTAALCDFAAAFLPEYERRKQLRGWLDFDDLIEKTHRLLGTPEVAEWVLFRLDGGIDHILVDEAQDTSPVQWQVIERLAREFTAGQGARPDVTRTIFVVGDKKQSIYSFQGADPEAFDRMQEVFATRLRDAGAGLESLTLEHSFRSSQAILRLVDLVFDGRAGGGLIRDAQHIAFKPDLPGRVDLWPVVPKADAEDAQPWTDPVDRPSARHHTVVLAERIAGAIGAMLENGETVPIDTDRPGEYARRPVRPGDFLILLQRRSDLFAEIIRACKSAGLPIAGADRLKVGAELAVRDLGALLSFLATPEDNLSLATTLRSPLLGWSEQALFDLAHRRDDGAYLWTALRDRRDEFPDTMAMLDDLRDQADFLRPYDLIERTLTRHDGRRKLLGRLGSEAEDGINALLSQALAYESQGVPSLTGFLIWMETDDLEIKRQTDSTGNLIRVMTVHGAKGLESPIVILPDTAARRAPKGSAIMAADGLPLWRMTADQMPALQRQTHENATERQMNERLRLLYVALTRAEKWLIVAAAGDLDKDGNSWYQHVESALKDAGAEQIGFQGGTGLRLSHGDWDGLPLQGDVAMTAPHIEIPAYFHAPASPPPAARQTLSPSDLGGAKALPGEDGLNEEVAKMRGTRLHLLLQHLPDVAEADWNATAERLMPDTDEATRADLLAECRPVLCTDGLRHIFAPGTMAEVPFTADLGGRRLHGTIDRLIVGDDRVLAVDYKSNAVIPADAAACPEGLLRQLGAYAHALAQIYPDRRIDTAILWTGTAQLMPVPHDAVTDALARAPCLDDGPARS